MSVFKTPWLTYCQTKLQNCQSRDLPDWESGWKIPLNSISVPCPCPYKRRDFRPVAPSVKVSRWSASFIPLGKINFTAKRFNCKPRVICSSQGNTVLWIGPHKDHHISKNKTNRIPCFLLQTHLFFRHSLENSEVDFGVNYTVYWYFSCCGLVPKWIK